MMISDTITRDASLPWFIKDISGLHYDRNIQNRGATCRN